MSNKKSSQLIFDPNGTVSVNKIDFYQDPSVQDTISKALSVLKTKSPTTIRSTPKRTKSK